MRFFFNVDQHGKVVSGTAIETFPDGFVYEGTEEVWLNQERSFYDFNTRTWTIYGRLNLFAPSVTAVDTPFTVMVILPEGSPDTEVQFRVAWQDDDGNWHRTDPIVVVVANGKASKDFQFATAGKYLIEALSEHHGLASAEVVVS